MILTASMAAALRNQGFCKMVAAARFVEVRDSPYVPSENFYALDCESGFFMPEFTPDDMKGKVLILCAPRHLTLAKNLVRLIRAPEPNSIPSAGDPKGPT